MEKCQYCTCFFVATHVRQNAAILEEVAARKQYMFIKEKLIHMLKFYEKNFQQ